ncbi:hypothetical protein LCGC14_2767410, partial [marine sediment metagenome]
MYLPEPSITLIESFSPKFNACANSRAGHKPKWTSLPASPSVSANNLIPSPFTIPPHPGTAKPVQA